MKLILLPIETVNMLVNVFFWKSLRGKMNRGHALIFSFERFISKFPTSITVTFTWKFLLGVLRRLSPSLPSPLRCIKGHTGPSGKANKVLGSRKRVGVQWTWILGQLSMFQNLVNSASSARKTQPVRFNLPLQSLFDIQVRTAIIHNDNIQVIITCLITDPRHFVDEMLRPASLVLYC